MTLKYSSERNRLIVHLPSGNKGKFRLKARNNPFEYGVSFAGRKFAFSPSVYLEWQIGYDTTVKDEKSGKKKTSLRKISFIGANGKTKHPYELSELISESLNLSLLNKSDIESVLSWTEQTNRFFSERKISAERADDTIIEGFNFAETRVYHPTLIFNDTPDGTQIQISLEKQQYASGVQPMVYLCIPLSSFSNGGSFLDRPSVPSETLDYKIDRINVVNLLTLCKIFGMCSPAHKHDITEILKSLLEQQRQ